MLKRLGFSAVAVLALLVLLAAPQAANARVRFGVTVGGPIYAYPAVPYDYAYTYPYPYPYAYPTYYRYNYVRPGFGYAPYSSFGFAWGRHHGYERHEHHEHGHHR